MATKVNKKIEIIQNPNKMSKNLAKVSGSSPTRNLNSAARNPSYQPYQPASYSGSRNINNNIKAKPMQRGITQTKGLDL